MKHAIGALLVCGCVWLATGCKNVDMLGALGLQSMPDGSERVVAGSVDVVADTTMKALARVNLKATKTSDEKAVYINTATSSGARFRLVLTQEATQAGLRTRMRVEWIDSNRNEEVTFNLLSSVAATHKN